MGIKVHKNGDNNIHFLVLLLLLFGWYIVGNHIMTINRPKWNLKTVIHEQNTQNTQSTQSDV